LENEKRFLFILPLPHFGLLARFFLPWPAHPPHPSWASPAEPGSRCRTPLSLSRSLAARACPSVPSLPQPSSPLTRQSSCTPEPPAPTSPLRGSASASRACPLNGSATPSPSLPPLQRPLPRVHLVTTVANVAGEAVRSSASPSPPSLPRLHFAAR
jgi:hypothetical protein